MSQILVRSMLAFWALAFCLGNVGMGQRVDVIDVDINPVLISPAAFGPDVTPERQASLRTELAAASRAAEATFESRILGYSTELPNSLRLQLTSLRITVDIQIIDGMNGILAFAGPDAILSVTRQLGVNDEQTNTVPLEASVTFDVDDLVQLSDAGLLETVAAHEICHALGFGGFLLAQNGLSGPVGGVGLNQYIGGRYALPTYRQESGDLLAGFIPLQQTGAGSAGGHWDLNVPLFDRRDIDNSHDLMLAFIDVDNPPTIFITETTFALLADTGFAVSGFNDQFLAPAGTGTGRWPKVVGPGTSPFRPNGTGFPDAGLSFARVSGQTSGVVATTEASGNGENEVTNTDKVDPYNLRNLRWNKTTR